MRNERSYTGKMMAKGKANEEILMAWLGNYSKDIIDFREFRLAQRIDVDFGIETLDGNILLAEIKSDRHIKEDGNLCFEVFRINHFSKIKPFYLGWGYRSPAQKIIVRNPETGYTFIFNFQELREFVGAYINKSGRNTRINITETDKVKTTFNFLIPMNEMKEMYKKFLVL